jgi:hypothetical protein
MRTCKTCNQSNNLPLVGVSDSYWIWENKKDRKSGGLHYCRVCRTTKKRVAWNAFYLRKQLRCVVSRSIAQKLKRHGGHKQGSILKTMPWTIEELKTHLESKFKPGMTWDNYGDWHVDHKKPDSSFIYQDMKDEGFLESWSLSNLQPLWADDNRRKYNKEVY